MRHNLTESHKFASGPDLGFRTNQKTLMFVVARLTGQSNDCAKTMENPMSDSIWVLNFFESTISVGNKQGDH